MKEDYKITIGVEGYIVADVKGAHSMEEAIERTQKILDIFEKRYKGLKINDETQLYIHVQEIRGYNPDYWIKRADDDEEYDCDDCRDSGDGNDDDDIDTLPSTLH